MQVISSATGGKAEEFSDTKIFSWEIVIDRKASQADWSLENCENIFFIKKIKRNKIEELSTVTQKNCKKSAAPHVKLSFSLNAFLEAALERLPRSFWVFDWDLPYQRILVEKKNKISENVQRSRYALCSQIEAIKRIDEK